MLRQLEEAQEYLTVSGNGSTKRIFALEALLNRHGVVKVCLTLERLLMEKRVRLQGLIEEDKTRKEIDEVVAEMFRIHMAASLLKEVISSEHSQQAAGRSSEFPGRRGSSRGMSRLREDKNHDRAYSQAGKYP